MGRRVGCSLPKFDDAFVVLPDEWLGEHAERYDQAIRAAAKRFEGRTLINFSIALTIAENWGGIPGLEGKPENWDFTKLPLELISWMNQAVLNDYALALSVPKVSSAPSSNGSEDPDQMASVESTETSSPGDSMTERER